MADPTFDQQRKANVASELEETYNAILELDKQGDAEGVRTLTAYAESLESERDAGVPESGLPAPAKPKAGRGQMEGQALRSVAAGVGRVAAGAGQLVNMTAHGLSGGALGVPGKDYNSAADDFLTAIRGKEYTADMDASEWLPERAAELGIGFALGVPSKAAGWVQTLKQAALNSGLGAAMTYDQSYNVAEKAGSIALGTLAGVGIGGAMNAVAGAPHAGLRWLMKRFMKDPDVAQQAAHADLVKNFPELAEYMTFAQQTGSRQMGEAQARSAGQFAQKAYREQDEILRKELEKWGGRYGPNWKAEDAGQIIAQRGTAAARAEKSNLAKVRKSEWDAMIGSAEAAVTARKIAHSGIEGSEQIMFDAQSVDDALTGLVEQFNVSKDALSPAIKRFRQEIHTFKGQVSIETLLDVLKKTNGNNFNPVTGQVTDDTQKAFAREFKRSLFGAIDDAPDGTSDAITWIKRARQSYAHRSSQIEGFENSFVAKSLGLDGANPDPVDALVKITSASRSQQAQMRNLLNEHDPQLLNELRGMAWAKSMDSASSRMDDASKSTFDPMAHANRMLSLVGTKGDEMSGLFSKADAEAMREILEPIRAIAYSRQFLARAPEMESIAMTTAAAVAKPVVATPFLARQAFRIFSQRAMDRKLFTGEGRKKLMSAYEAIGTPRFDAALGRLLAMPGPYLTTDE